MKWPLNLIKKDDICAEIGVWKGKTSELILDMEPKKLHLIDCWIHQNYKDRMYSVEFGADMDEIYNMVVNKFKDDSRVEIHREKSIDVVFPEKYFDWVYIDGDHSFEAVLEDLYHYYPLIKSGGYLCGDDYGWVDVNCSRGPKPAVDYFVKVNNLELQVRNTENLGKGEVWGKGVPFVIKKND